VRFGPGPGSRRLLAVFACLLAAALGTATWARNLDYESEVSIWRDVLTKRPENERAFAALSGALLEAREYPEAEEAARRAIALKHDYPNAWINLGMAQKNQGRPEEAARSLETAVGLDPGYYLSHYNLSVFYMDQGELEKALAHVNKSLEICPGYRDAMLNHAVILARSGNLEKAEEELRDLIRKAPLAGAFYNLGLVEETKGNRVQAGRWYARALEADPSDQKTRYNLATLLARQGQVREAAALFDIVLRHEARNVKALVNLGHTLALLGRKEEARLVYEKALRLEPQNGNAARGLASLSEKSP